MTETVRVYSKPSCGQCELTKNLLRKRGVLFIEEDLLDEGNLAAAKALGHMSAPVVTVGAESWSGFRPDKINDLAERINKGE